MVTFKAPAPGDEVASILGNLGEFSHKLHNMALLVQLKTNSKQSETPKLTLSFQAVREGAAELLNMAHCLPHSGQHSRLASRCPVTSRSVAQTNSTVLGRNWKGQLDCASRPDCPCDQRTPGRKSYLCAVCVKKVDHLRTNGRQTG